jgi:hypothetical protein
MIDLTRSSTDIRELLYAAFPRLCEDELLAQARRIVYLSHWLGSLPGEREELRRVSALIRTFLALAFLVGLAAAIWYGVRWMESRDELEATLIFDSADELVPGNLVLSGALVIGEVTRVTPLQGKDAVSIRISKDHRDQVRTDSRFRIDGNRPEAVVLVGSKLAFGRPVREGDVLYARQSGVSRWLEEKGGGLLARVREEASRIGTDGEMKEKLQQWEGEIPSWKQQGDEILAENLETISGQVDRLEARLRESGKELDARRIRRDFEGWLARVRAGARPEPGTGDTGPASTASP